MYPTLVSPKGHGGQTLLVKRRLRTEVENSHVFRVIIRYAHTTNPPNFGSQEARNAGSMKIKEWITENVDFKRNDTEIRSNQGYGATMGAAGFATGILTGIIVIILQFAVSGHEAQETWINIVCAVALLAMVGYLIFMLMPVFADKSISAGDKAVTVLISIGCLIGLFIAGVYLTIFLFMLVAVIVVAWLALKVWLSSSTSSSSSSQPSPRQDYHGPEKYKLDDGTTVTENSFGGGFHGDDYHNYEKNPDGTFTRVD